MNDRKLTWLKSIALFIGFTSYFFILLFTLYPFLKETFTFNPALNWFMTGYCLFIPLFIFSIALIRGEGNKGFKNIALPISKHNMHT